MPDITSEINIDSVIGRLLEGETANPFPGSLPSHIWIPSVRARTHLRTLPLHVAHFTVSHRKP